MSVFPISTDRLKGGSKSLLRAFRHAPIRATIPQNCGPDRRVARVAPMAGRHPPVTGGW
ncbi:hypothetical protein [Micromonospora maris]|uniref:hypothetical protein n=1 Tax=Micromonospora maris TaxID=1003110 RepID=UPI002E13643D|nr:hypothetical protein OG712_17590 [Micromonospora maris]